MNRTSEFGIQSLPDATDIATNILNPRPIGGLVRRQPSADRIDAKSEEAIELSIEYLSLQNTRP
jgi:hypothetical protein